MNVGSSFAARRALAVAAAATLMIGLCGAIVPFGVGSAEAVAKRKVTTTKRRTTTLRVPTTRRVVTTVAPTTAPIAPATPSTLLAATLPAVSTSTTIAPNAVTFQQSIYALTVSAGGSTSVPLWLTIAAGFNQPVTLRIVSAPAGISMAFDQNPIRNYAVATVAATISALSGPAPIFELQAVSTGGGVLSTAKVAVFVVNGTTAGTGGTGGIGGGDPTVAPDIAVSYSTSPIALFRGGEVVSARIEIARQGGLSEVLDIYEVGALPVGVIVSFDNRKIAGDSATVFVRAGASTSVGPFTVRLEIQTSKRRVPVELTFNVS